MASPTSMVSIPRLGCPYGCLDDDNDPMEMRESKDSTTEELLFYCGRCCGHLSYKLQGRFRKTTGRTAMENVAANGKGERTLVRGRSPQTDRYDGQD